jgi:hypothetical protein
MIPVKTMKTTLSHQMNIEKAALFLTAFLALNIFTFSFPDRTIPQGSVEFTLGSYSMNEPRFEAAYPKGGLMGGLTLSSAVVSNFNFYLDIKYYSRKGALTFSKEKTTFYLVPIDLGFRYIYPLGFFHPYLGAGLDFYFYYEDNPIGTVLNYTNGYHITGGTYLRFAKSVPVMLNIRVKYTWAKAEEDTKQIQLGGLEYCAGLAFAF